MALVSLIDVALDAGSRRLVEDCSLTIEAGERLALIGANGSGKSTLLRLLAGQLEPDGGRRRQTHDLVAAYVPQEEDLPAGLSLEQYLMQAAQEGGADAGAIAAGVQRTLAELGAEGGLALDRASGGWRKRAALAAAFLRSPDLLLLDEPTNHLDLAAVRWLEDRLLDAAAPALVVVSHDRWLLQRVATRCMEIGARFPAGHFVAAGDYETFCGRRDAFLIEQQSRQRKLAEQLRRESAWLARTPKARTGKSAARVEAAGELQAELAQVQQRTGADRSAQVAFQASGRRGNELVVAEGLSKAFGAARCFADLDLTIAPGDRLGLLGGNGSGKTTLLRVLAGQLPADAGRLKRAHALQVVYADQQRADLAPEQTVAQALAPNGEHVQVGEQRWHLRAWAARHGLREEQLNQSISALSGGERARVQIARLAVQPADLLLLDEPTNDCDIPLLERLEQAIAAHAGAVVLVSHDRYLLERSCTTLLAFDGRGEVRRLASVAAYEAECRLAASSTAHATPTRTAASGGGLSWDEQRELRALPGRITSAEERLAATAADLVDPAVCRDQATAARLQRQRDEQQAELDQLMERWLELDERAS